MSPVNTNEVSKKLLADDKTYYVIIHLLKILK